jgi:flagellar hook-basal body complex protein FliE
MVTPVRFPSVPTLEGPASREMPLPVSPDEKAGSSDFTRLVSKAIDSVNKDLNDADKTTKDFLQGKADIHQLVMSLESADLSFRLLSRIRNKVIEAYKEVSRIS